jgi:transcription elongation GreA/GreB family factor
MNKQTVLAQVLAQLKCELALIMASAQATHEEATHEENKAEDKYDTRGLEASYLAMGQLKQAEETKQAVQAFESLVLRDFVAGESISLGALVALDAGGQSTHYFMGPRAGGTEISCEGQAVMVITPQSPLGRQLMGRHQGDTLQLDLGGKRTAQQVVTVQ